jgi:competence protein ComEC
MSGLGWAFCGSAAVWLLTLPIVAGRFHVVPWIGIPLNLLLVPLTSVALIAAILLLALAAIWPPLGALPGWICTVCLGQSQWLVGWGALVRWGHAYVVSPPIVLAIAFLGFVAFFLVTRGERGVWSLIAAVGSVVSISAVIFLAYWPIRTLPAVLEANVLAVDHGLAITLESATGEVWLYDCGRMRDPHVGRRIIAPALWSMGTRRIDCLVFSHADADHLNGAIDLIERFAIGVVRIPEGFDVAENPDAREVIDRLRARGVRIEHVARGDRWSLGGEVEIEALAPDSALPAHVTDNERSVVLEVVARGRSFVMTGDLDGEGTVALVKGARRSIDVWLAPHHGGRTANPTWLYDWVEPRAVVASQRDRGEDRDPLRTSVPPGVLLFRTYRAGALNLIWTPGGGLEIRPGRGARGTAG